MSTAVFKVFANEPASIVNVSAVTVNVDESNAPVVSIVVNATVLVVLSKLEVNVMPAAFVERANTASPKVISAVAAATKSSIAWVTKPPVPIVNAVPAFE